VNTICVPTEPILSTTNKLPDHNMLASLQVWELAAHAAMVFVGARPALDPATAQPVGPKEDLNKFLLDTVVATAAMMVGLLLVRSLGVAIAVHLGGFRPLRKDVLGRSYLPKKTKSFRDAFVELFYYTCSLSAITKVAWNADWFWPGGWQGVMFDGRVQQIPDLQPYTIPADFKFLYAMETSYYLASFVLLLIQRLRRETRKDFVEMAAHHVITAALLSLSFATGYMRIGLVVMFLHNCFDPFLHLAKLAKYLRLPLLPDVSFVICAVTFALSRLYYYPSAILQAWLGVCVGNKSCPGGVWDKTPVEMTLIALLMALIPIHCLWFYMILMVLKKAIASLGVQGDVRSDSEEEEDERPPRVKSE